MSMKLLNYLNGSNEGLFKNWITQCKGESRISWYPSAGEDFRDLLYLGPNFINYHPSEVNDPSQPVIYLHTDYFPWKSSKFLDSKEIYVDSKTSITVSSIEELPRCDLLLDPKIVDFPSGSTATGKVFFMKINVDSTTLGSYSVPLLYAFCENAAFYSSIIEPNQGVLSHIVHVRYGGGCGGGGKSTGAWLLNVLKNVRCEVFITDNHLNIQSGDKRVFEIFKNISYTENKLLLEKIRTIPSVSWSDHGDVEWNIVK